MKKLTASLHNGNLTPRERYLMLIQNDIERLKTGKDLLTEADKKALLNWQAKNNSESQEWNRLNDGWRYSACIGMEIEFIFSEAKCEHLRKLPFTRDLLFYSMHREMRRCMQRIKRMKKVSIRKAMEIAEKQKIVKLRDGMDFDYVVYQLAFESLSEELKKDILALYPDAGIETSYLDQEEIVADLLAGRDTLVKEDIEKLGELVAAHSYNRYAKQYQLYHYFADIPILEVARRYAAKKGLKVGKDTVEADYKELRDVLKEYAANNKTSVEAMLKETVIEWFEEGLPYPPLVIDDGKETINNIDTVLPHKEVFAEWLKAKEQAKKTLQKLIDSGSLGMRDRTEEEMRHDTFVNELKRQELYKKIIGKTYDSNKIITGDSLYVFVSDWTFVKEFKEGVDEYNPNLGIVYADDDQEQTGEHLDQELMICGLNDEGEASIFSLFGISMNMLENLIESCVYFKEVEKNGETFLTFTYRKFEDIFKEERQSLIDGYAKLLAFEKILKKVSVIYEADMTYRVEMLLKFLKEYIQKHNDALHEATGTEDDESKKEKHWSLRNLSILKLEDGMLINIEAIKPDDECIEEHVTELKEIFGDEFSMT